MFKTKIIFILGLSLTIINCEAQVNVNMGDAYLQQQKNNSNYGKTPHNNPPYINQNSNGGNHTNYPHNNNNQSYHNNDHYHYYNGNPVYYYNGFNNYSIITNGGDGIYTDTTTPLYAYPPVIMNDNSSYENYNDNSNNNGNDNTLNSLINLYNRYQEQVSNDVKMYNFYKANQQDDMANNYLNDYQNKMEIMNDLYSEIQSLQ